MICRNCKEEFSCNQSDVEGVCFSCVQRIVEDYLSSREEDPYLSADSRLLV